MNYTLEDSSWTDKAPTHHYLFAYLNYLTVPVFFIHGCFYAVFFIQSELSICMYFEFSVYPIVSMTETGSTINCKKNPEGYITDIPFSSIRRKPDVGHISAKLDNLPMATTVRFQFGKVLIRSLRYSSLSIRVQAKRNDTSRKNTVYMIEKSVREMMVKVTVDHPLIVDFRSRFFPSNEELIRVKYKG